MSRIYTEVLSLYNGEVKEHFFTDINFEESTKLNYFHTFKRADESLKRMGKDFYELNQSEMEEVLYACKATSLMSIASIFSNITVYTRWAEDNGYIENYMPVFTDSSFMSNMEKFVVRSFSTYFTQDQLINLYNQLSNIQDAFILQCIFEGIRGKGSSEIINLKIADFKKKNDEFYANLYDTKSGEETLNFIISEYLYDLAHRVDAAESVMDNRGLEMQLEPSVYILKRTGRGSTQNGNSPQITQNVILNKAHYMKMIFKDQNFSLKNVERSGVMHFIDLYMKRHYPNQTTVPREILSMIAQKFKIGLMYSEAHGKDFVNYSMVKNKIDEKWLKSTYGYTLDK